MKSEELGEPQQRSLWHQFTQQRLRAWKPILAPHWIITIYIGGGLLLLGLGLATLLISWRVVEHVYDYTDVADPVTGLGSFTLNITQAMQPPIWIYYELDGFHQNHWRFVHSRSETQLIGTDPPAFHESGVPECRPWTTGEDGRVLYPCGLIARSVFNDTFALQLHRSRHEAEVLSVDSAARTIAWPADASGRYRNLDPEQVAVVDGEEDPHQVALDMWITRQFPPVTCEQTEISDDKPYVPVTVALRNETSRSGRQVEVADCRSHKTDHPSCNFERDGVSFACDGHYRVVPRHNDWGIENGHFLVWMRIAGLPKFQKLWGKLDTTLHPGSQLQVHFKDNFGVKEFSGRKAFVISTSSMLGGRSDVLGYGYLLVGSCCLGFGIAFLFRYMVHRTRPLGDPTRLIPSER